MTDVHHVAFGDGAPLVALHGFSCDHRMMRPLLEPHFEGRERDDVGPVRRHYVDLPGMGRSPIGAVASSDDLADAVDAWWEETIGDEPALLVGLSYGGLIAREMLRRRPDRIRGMALVVPVVEPLFPDRTVPPHAPLVSRPDELADLPEGDREEFCAMAVVQTRAAYEDFRAQIVPGLRAADQDALARIQSHYALSTDVGEWGGPVTIVCGRQDSVVGWEDQLRLLSRYPRASFAALDGGGHNVHLERPAAVGALLEDWLGRCGA